MEKKNHLFSLLLCTIVWMVSCTKELKVNVSNENDRVVIDALVTDQLTPYTVQLSKTLAIDQGNNFPAINNAFVTIGDDAGHLDTLPLVTNGLYTTKGARQGVVGRTYFLTVQVDGQTYVAQDKLLSVSKIDTMNSVYQAAGSGLGITENGYYIYYSFKDIHAPNSLNYYYYEVYRNNISVLNSSQVGVFSDQFLTSMVENYRLPGKFNIGDKALFKLYSLSESAYNFYNGMQQQLQNDGGFFSTPPANTPSNLSNGALGFFRVSSLSQDSLMVNP